MPTGSGGPSGSVQNSEGSWAQKFAGNFRLDRDPNTPKLSLKLLREMWELTVPYWKRKGAWTSYVITALQVALTFGGTVLSAEIAKFGGDQLDALAKHEGTAFYHLLIVAIVIQVVNSLIFTVFTLPYSIMILRWREWLTERFIRDYLQDTNYYALNRDRAVDNPDERIAIDIPGFITYPMQLLFGLLQCVSNLVVFGYVLGSFGWYLVPACAGYYALYSVTMMLFTKPILNLSYAQRRLDGDFRFALVNVRVNAESVAFLRGERVERRELSGRLRALIDNFVKNVWWSSLLSVWFTFTGNFGSTLLPALLIAPLVLHGRFTISAFTQTQNAWGNLGSAFGFIGDQAMSFAYGGALIARLHTMHEHMVGKQQKRLSAGHEIRHIVSDHLAVRDFTLETPDGARVLIEGLSFDLPPDVRMMVTGPNGAGKSSLLRGLAGLWTRGSGKLYLPPREKVMFLPQRPYMSLGTFREQLTYPDNLDAFDDDSVRGILQEVKLGYLEERFGGMGVKLDWTHVLSPGEQQRIAVARALLRRSKLVILDEATSSVDVEGEQLLYELLRKMGATYLSVAHRVTLVPYHQLQLTLLGNGRWTLTQALAPSIG
ncbi:MAG TPA: ATP-binding cassette domain-containing protein [Candidatus Aquilonibacter sp.]|nr:ATP-binding cassette domain-containing protein [Candidatus Aquilonibacter sp.]